MLRENGAVVGPFEIIASIGTGGMGQVLEARDVRTGEIVALKLLVDDSLESLLRFQREVRIVSRLSHPNVVTIHSHGTADGTAWLAMERLCGRDLAETLRAGRLSVAATLRIGVQICAALEHAHERQVIHRDLKPENIFMMDDADATVKVLDFGIARAEGETRHTRTGHILGTLAYMSPEQARGERDVDARSDLWSLGAVLYRCLAGAPPFHAETGPGVLYRILLEPAQRLEQRVAGIPADVAETIHRALAKAREERYPSATAMRLALATALTGLRREFRREVGPFTPAPGPLAATATSLVPESRLTCVAYLKAVATGHRIDALAAELRGRVVHLSGGDALVVFGIERWSGDEPERALRLAQSSREWCAAVGVATGRVVRDGEQVAGQAVDSAVRIAVDGEVRLEPATAAAVSGRFTISTAGPGSFRLETSDSVVIAAERPFASPFVGREIDLSMLLESLATAVSESRPVTLLITGSAGMGKTRLRHEALALAAERHPDISCAEAVCELFRRDSPLAALASALPASPDLDESLREAGDGAPMRDAEFGLDRLHAALEAALRRLALRGPVLLIIDDAQWLDAASRQAIRWACDELTDVPLAVWLFSRPEGRESLATLVEGATVRELPPLSVAQSQQMLRVLVGEAPEIVVERAAGCPRFVEELARAYDERGSGSFETGPLPISVEGAVLAQLDQLEPQQREYLKRAAIFGRTAWHEAVVGLGGDASALASLRRNNLVVMRSPGRLGDAKEFGFRGVLLRDVAYGLWTEIQVRELHRLAVRWLQTREGPTPDEIAVHFDLAGEPALAAAPYVTAAERAASFGDVETTNRLVGRALERTTDARLRWRALVARDSVLQLARDAKLQEAGLTEIDELAPQLGVPEMSEAAWRQCYFARLQNRAVDVVKWGERAIELAASLPGAPWPAAARIDLAALATDEGRFEEALTHALQAEALARLTRDRRLIARAMAAVAYVQIERDHVQEALDLAEWAASDFERAGDRRRAALALSNAQFALLRLGRFTDAEQRVERVIELSRAVGNHRTLAVAHGNRATIRRIRGDFSGARADLDIARRDADRLSHHRLAAAVAIEDAYVSIADRQGESLLPARAADIVALAERARSPALLWSAHSVALRVMHRGGLDVSQALANARQMMSGSESPTKESMLELSIAIYEAGGANAADAEMARDALEKMADGATDVASARQRIDAACARFMVQPEIAGESFDAASLSPPHDR